MKLCPICETPFQGHGNRLYCSRSCLFKAGSMRVPIERKREYRRRHEAKRTYRKTCRTCGIEFRASLNKQKHCYTCRPKRAGNNMRRQVVLYQGPPFTPPIFHARGTCEWTAGSCRVCGTAFVSQYREITCSEECTGAYHKNRSREKCARRRALKRTALVEKISPALVFERDGWKCHICKQRIRRTYEYPHPKSATLDHIIPLSLGGTHEYANVAAAHFICNSRKSNRGYGDQLALL